MSCTDLVWGFGSWGLNPLPTLQIDNYSNSVTKTRLWTIFKNKHFSWNSLRKSLILASLVHMSKENNFKYTKWTERHPVYGSYCKVECQKSRTDKFVSINITYNNMYNL